MNDKDYERAMLRVQREIEALERGEIVSMERSLLRIGAVGALTAACNVSNARKIEVGTDLFADGTALTEIRLYRRQQGEIFFLFSLYPDPLYTLPEMIEVCQKVRENMDSGLPFYDACRPFLPEGA